MKDAAQNVASLLREAASFIELQSEELQRMTMDRDALRSVVEELQVQLSIARLVGVP